MIRENFGRGVGRESGGAGGGGVRELLGLWVGVIGDWG
jgi:hypothetical protein